jgi:hypothetical protein
VIKWLKNHNFSNSDHYPCICLEGLRKTTTIPSQGIPYPSECKVHNGFNLLTSIWNCKKCLETVVVPNSILNSIKNKNMVWENQTFQHTDSVKNWNGYLGLKIKIHKFYKKPSVCVCVCVVITSGQTDGDKANRRFCNSLLQMHPRKGTDTVISHKGRRMFPGKCPVLNAIQWMGDCVLFCDMLLYKPNIFLELEYNSYLCMHFYAIQKFFELCNGIIITFFLK